MTVTRESLQARLAHLQWQQERGSQEKATLEHELALTNGRLALAPKLLAHMEAVQQQTHAQTVGAYEAILTEMLHEVIGPSRRVTMAAGYKNSQPALDIKVIQSLSGVEYPEDILEGNGGALTNVVVAGSRFAVIARSGKRRFLVLDEPDCWLKTASVPHFFKALADVCDQAKFQAIVVSHHHLDHARLPASVSHVHLRATAAGLVEAECSISGPVEEGFTQLRASNYRTHSNTVIDLGPGLTVLSGDVNLGKSALAGSIRLLARGGAGDSHIRHGAPQMSIGLTLRKAGQTHNLELTCVRKGSPKVTLTHTIDGNPTGGHVERGSRHEAPDWMSDLLDLDEIEGLDPQFLGQKKPVFLLDESAAVRAKLLYAGREASILAKMFAIHRARKDEDQKAVTRNTTILVNLNNKLNALTDLPRHAAGLSQLRAAEEGIQQTAKQQQALGALIPRLARITPIAQLALPAISITPPVLFDTAGLRRTAILIGKLSRTADAYQQVTLPALPELKNAAGLKQMGLRLGRLQGLSGLCAPALPIVPTLRPVDALKRHISQHARLDLTIQSLTNEHTLVLAAIELEKQNLELLAKAMGNTCPTCHQPVSSEQLIHAAHHHHS